MDDSASETLKSANVSVNEKSSTMKAESLQQESRSPTPDLLINNGESDLKTEKEVELTRVMTSAEGVEYPTGVKLGLISLALCLSVFLIALVVTGPYHCWN